MNGRRAFSLMELLVTLGIIAILAALIVPGAQYLRAKANTTQCLNHLRQIGVALELYLGEHNMQMPQLAAGRASKAEELPVIDTVLAPYVGDDRVFECPADREQFEKSGTSYYWNSVLSGQNVNQLNFLTFTSDKSRIPLIFDKEGWHPGSNGKVQYLYADGSASDSFRVFTQP